VEKIHRKIKSFVRREGRMSQRQANAYENYMSDYGLIFEQKLISFNDLFNNDSPVTLEIGFGMGHSLVEQASRYSEQNFLGIEVHRPGVGSILADIQEKGLTNLRVICHDAIEIIEHMLADDSLSKAQLFFPDPWHKSRHHKRRIVKPEFVQSLQKKLKLGGLFHMATDWENYAEHMLEVMQQEQGWKNHSDNNTFVARPESRPETKFEKRGERLGHGVWDLIFEKE
jgi:tRNA (guanine-N7-)-methyltransferase